MEEENSPTKGKGETTENKGKSKEINLSELSADDMREEQRIEMAKHLLIGTKVDKALEFLHETDPIDNIEKTLQDSKVEVRNLDDQMQQRIQDWLGTWDKVISEGEDLPVDLIGRAVELAKSSREK